MHTAFRVDHIRFNIILIGDITLIPNNKLSNEDIFVRIADGSQAKVQGTGMVRVTAELTLNHVLIVPNTNAI